VKIRIACKHCGIERRWERGKDDIVRPEQSPGPYGVGHYPYICQSPEAPKGICEPRELATAMSVEAARAMSKRLARR
jgi:hypothetical protein